MKPSMRHCCGLSASGATEHKNKMQDKLTSSLDLANVSLTLSDGHLVDGRDNEPQVIKSRNKYGSAITVQKIGKTLSIKGNPIGFLTGQNVFGTCDMPALNKAMFDELEEMGAIRISREGRRRIDNGEYYIQEIAFSQYMQCDPKRKRDQVSHLEMLYTSVVPDWNGHSIHSYHECGFIVRRRNQSMTVYDKLQELHDKNMHFNSKYTGDVETQLDDKLRVELTFKYNWLQGRNLLEVRRWGAKVHNDADGDWRKLARKLVIEGIEQFKLPYILECGNVFHDAFVEQMDSRAQGYYAKWLKGDQKMEASEKRALMDYGLWAEIGPSRHKQLLWQRMFPGVNVVEALTGRHESMLRVARSFNQVVLPRDPMCGDLLPLVDTIRGSGPRKRLARIEKRLGM